MIVLINAVSGAFSLGVIQDLGLLVNKTYDRALMGGTFAQASKFDFSQYDLEIQSALLAHGKEDFKLHLNKARRLLRTLKEDLEVVEERSLSSKSSDFLKKISTSIDQTVKLQQDVVQKKELLLEKAFDARKSIELNDEWNSNSSKKELYRSLTTAYDDMAEVGYLYRLNSEAENKENFQRTIIILISSLVLSLGLGLLLSYLIIKPLFRLKDSCTDIASGDFSSRSGITGKDEFGTLSSSFNYMLDTIEEKTESMSTLLSSLPFGLFYFDKSGKISSERSKATDTLFPDFTKWEKLSDFFEAHQNDSSKLDQILQAMFQKLLPFKSAAFLLPQVIRINPGDHEKILNLSYRPKNDQKGKLERVILMAEDVTAKEKALRENKKMTERVERISKVSKDIPGFKEFLKSVRSLFADIDSSKDLKTFKRHLHTLKGVLGIFAFHEVAGMVHEFEEKLKSVSGLGELDLKTDLKAIKELFSAQGQDLEELLSVGEDHGLKFYDRSKIENLVSLLKKRNDPALASLAEMIDRFPLDKAMGKYVSHAKSLSQKLAEKEVEIVFDPSDEVSLEEIQKLDPVFIHLLNNSLDHGIESVSERLQKNKSRTGQIHISCTRSSDNALVFKISDDGKGIDGDRLLSKAVSQGMIKEEEALKLDENAKLNLIFADGLSSRESASLVSGRGVGMDAVKRYLDNIGGSIQLSSQINLGTTFVIQVPLERH